MKKIAWYGPAAPGERQVAELKRLFGANSMVDFRRQIRNATDGVGDFRASRAHECVIVGPLAVLEHVLQEGVKPLWSEAVEENDPAQVEFKGGGGKGFRFLRFRRLMALKLVYNTELTAQKTQTPPPHTVAWLSRHAPTQGALLELQQHYGKELRLQQNSRPFRDAREVIDRMRGACDLVLVAPLSIFDALTKQGIHPIQAQLVEGQVVLRRVTGLHMEFEDFD